MKVSGALLVVFEGEARVTKFIDGIEQVVGRRGPGELFGEVPIVLGTPFLANLLAVSADTRHANRAARFSRGIGNPHRS